MGPKILFNAEGPIVPKEYIYCVPIHVFPISFTELNRIEPIDCFIHVARLVDY